MKILSLLAGVLTLATVLTNPARAATTNYWSANSVILGGTGTWNTTSTTNWSPDQGLTYVAWTNANYDIADFTNYSAWNPAPGATSASSIMINLAGQTLNVGGLRFEDFKDIFGGGTSSSLNGRLDYYDITNGTLNFAPGGGSIFVDSGSNPFITFAGCIAGGVQSQGSIIRAVISGSGTLTKTGPGTLCLLASNTFAGTLAINQGWVAVGENQESNSTPYDSLQNITNITIADGAALGAYGTNVAINPPINLSGNATATITGNLCPFNNGNQGVPYKFTYLNQGIHGVGNVVFRGVNMINQLSQIYLNAPCDYNGSTLLTVGNGDLYAMTLVDLITGQAFNISQNNFNADANVTLGVNNALPPGTSLFIDGQIGITNFSPVLYRCADLYLHGHNQTLAGLSNTNRYARAQRILNLGSDSAATLTISNTTDCTFSGSIGNINNTPFRAGAVGGICQIGVDGNNITLVKSGSGTFTISGPPKWNGVPDYFGYSSLLGNYYTNGTIINGGTLNVANTAFSATGTGPVNINTGGTLAGTGIISGLVANNAGGTLSPGTAGSGTLTLDGNVMLNAGSTNTFFVDGTASVNTVVALGTNNTVTYGGVLKIVPSGTFALGQTFTLFSGAGATNASNFGSIVGSAGSGQRFSFANGVLTVVTDPGGPVAITNSYSGGVLSLSWPASQGWRLQAQTNALSTGLSANWVYLTGASVSSTTITVDATQPTVFYRLTYP